MSVEEKAYNSSRQKKMLMVRIKVFRSKNISLMFPIIGRNVFSNMFHGSLFDKIKKITFLRLLSSFTFNGIFFYYYIC